MPLDLPHFNQALPRVCLIGAGSSGIAVAKALKDAHIPFVCYETSDRVGGNWVFKNPNGTSSAYRSLHINTSRRRMQYHCFPMPADYPDFPHHSLMASYFQRFTEHFDLAPYIHFGATVQRVEPHADGTYLVSLADGSQERFDVVAVANGHHWDPRPPDPPFEGQFDGVELHSHHYIDPAEPQDLRGKRVAVVGMGNSAMDIACELCRPGVAEKVFLVARRGAWVVPKYLFGKPLDEPLGLPFRLPLSARVAIARGMILASVGRMEKYGLPRPDHEPGSAHPTISSDLFIRLGSGDITPKPNIERLEGSHLRFVDGTREQVDAVVYCTGYNVRFPFFDESFVSAPDNRLPLFRRAFKPGLPNLFFVGLCQPLGAVMPIAEQQGHWLAEYLCGRYALPDEDEMRADMDAEEGRNARRYVASPRHTMQVDFDDYLAGLRDELAAGRERARRRSWALPVPTLARHVD